MSLKQTVPPTSLPISLQAARDHVKVVDNEDDADLSRYIDGARAYAETRLGRQLITATWRLKCDMFPADDFIELPNPPLQSVTSLKYIDMAGDQQTFSSGSYSVDTDSEPGRIILNYDASWPLIRSQKQAIEITYVAGYGDDDSDMPAGIRNAMLLLVGHWFWQREAVVVGPSPSVIPLAVDSLIMTEHWGRYP